jgi:RHS repeat-associated protein
MRQLTGGSIQGFYVYGPDNLPVEQINKSTGAVEYLHHDQAGSTRLLTGSTGTVTGKCSYGAYGTPTCEGTATMPLGYDGQYTSPDAGLIYLRNCVYDPTTAQFLSVDPLEAITGEPYAYANDNPINEADPTGLGFFGELEELGEEVGEGSPDGATNSPSAAPGGYAKNSATTTSTPAQPPTKPGDTPVWGHLCSYQERARRRGHLYQRRDRKPDGGSWMDRGVDSGGDPVRRPGTGSDKATGNPATATSIRRSGSRWFLTM